MGDPSVRLDRRTRAADRAEGGTPQRHAAHAKRASVDRDQAIRREVARAAQILDGFTALERTHHPRERAEDPGLLAGGALVFGGRLREEAAEAGGLARQDRHQLTAKPD